jgi:ribonuclease Z
MIDACLLGVGGTLPLPDRFLSSLLIRSSGQLILIDCGEGTQVSLRRLGWGLRDIGAILITHFHADHVAGLPGLLLTIGNSGRGANEPVHLFGPRSLTRVVDSLRVIAPRLPFPVVCHELTGDPADVRRVGDLALRACLGEHDLPCLSFRFDLGRLPAFQPDRAKALGLPVQLWKLLQRGETVVDPATGRDVMPQEVLGPARPGLSLGFLTDSRPTRELVEFHSDVDLLVCEGTYGDPDDLPKAIENKHMTFGEAGALAAAARAKALWLTHFTPAMPNPDYFRRHAQSAFPNVTLGHEHLATTLRFPD